MFSVKATYRNETRRISFESSSFPTYQELYTQLYRVFPIHNSYFLSGLVFSARSTSPSSRILIGKEAHSAEEYNKHVAPYQGRSWPNAVLRFSVHDENPHKAPSSVTAVSLEHSTDTTASVSGDASIVSETSSATVIPGSTDQDRFKRFAERKLVVERLRERIGNRPRPELSDFIAAEASGSSTRGPRHPSGRHLPDILRDEDRFSRPLPVAPNSQSGENAFGASNTHAQSVNASESLSLGSHPHRSRLPAFLESRPRSFVSTSNGHSVTRSFSTTPPLLVPPPPIIFSATTSKSSSSVDVEMASPKGSRARASSAQTARSPLPAQSVDAQSFKKDLEEIKEMLADMRCELQKSSSGSSSSSVPPLFAPAALPISNVPLPPPMIPNTTSMSRVSPRLTVSSYNPSYIVPPPPPIFASADNHRTAEEIRNATRETLDRLASHSKAMMQLHENIICDGCEVNGILGVRFKCLRCTDYDLCTACMSSPSIRVKHAAEHTFWPIDLPGDKAAYDTARANVEVSQVSSRDKCVHDYITCDVCHTRGFSGVRFKCLECEDYDMCEKCMWTPGAMSAHPPHAFFPIEDPTQFAAYGRARQLRTVLTKTPANVDRQSSPSKVHSGITCDACDRKPLTGVRFKCLQCLDYDLCRSCLSNPTVLESHDLKHKFWPVNEPNDLATYFRVQSRLSDSPIIVHDYVSCDGCDRTLVGVRHKCLDCDNYDLCTDCLSDPQQRQLHSLTHSFFPIVIPGDKSVYNRVRAEGITLPSIRLDPRSPRGDIREDIPQIHDNVVCDSCSDTIVGTRFKCLDCPDFDLCQSCVQTGARETHSSFHSFFEIETPGTYVHTVFSGDGERVHSTGRHDARQPAEVPSAPGQMPIVEPVSHNATCNLCDSRIRGDRYKCLNCPDFDTCAACFAITSEHHPGHGFVKVVTPDVLMLRNALRNDVTHPASCNNCDTLIRGTRYKCMHPSCPDFDLCQNCEAHPFPVHPDTHPMLKIKNIYSAIPALAKVSSAQAVASVQTSMPVAMDVEEETIGTIRELRRVYRTAAENYSSAPTLDSRVLSDAVKNEQLIRTAQEYAVPLRGDALTNEPMAVLQNPHAGESNLDSHLARQIENYQFSEATRRAFRNSASDPSDTLVKAQRGPEVSKDARMASHLMDLRTTYDMDDDEESVRNTRSAYRAMAVDNPVESITTAGDQFIRKVTEMETRSNTEQATSETLLLHAIESIDKARVASTSSRTRDVTMSPTPENMSVADSDNTNVASLSTRNANPMAYQSYVPMNVDDPRGLRPVYRSLFSTDPAAEYLPDVARTSQAVVDEMREVRRQYRNASSTSTDALDNSIFSALQDTAHADRSFVDHLSSSQGGTAEPDSPTLAIPSIPPLIPTAWSPPRWHVTTPRSPIVVHTMLATEHTPPYEPRPVFAAPASEDSVIEQTIVPPVDSNDAFVARSPVASSRRTLASVARPLSPERPLAAASKSGSERFLDEAIASTLGGLSTPSDTMESKATATPASVPKLGLVPNADWKELWPELATMFKHLLQPPVSEPSVSASMPGDIRAEEEPKQDERKETFTSDQDFHTAAEDSPLANEALLTRPAGSSNAIAVPDAFSLRHYLSTLAPTPSYVATYLSDNNIADGTIFPPGAEFVKSWRMRNDGDIAWPENTTLSFVAGDKISHRDVASSVKVGSVAPGCEVEVVGPEMKAPDAAGKYVSYWRLHDGQTSYFGHSVWVDITVAEMNHPPTTSSGEDSLAASSVIMPRSLEDTVAAAETHASTSSATIPSNPPSDDGSFESSISLIDAPSSPSIGEDEAIYEDSRSNVFADRPRDIEYVVLYDTSSDEE